MFTSKGVSPMVTFSVETSHDVDDDEGPVNLSDLPASYQTVDRVMAIITQMAGQNAPEDSFMEIAERTLN